jgi:hypothetical protein
VLLIERDSICRFIAAIRLGAEFPANGDLGSETHDSYPDLVADQSSYRLVYVTGIR